MATYTFVCLGHDETVATVESAECVDDKAALAAGARLFHEAPLIRDWPNCRHIEVYEGTELIGRVHRPIDSLTSSPAKIEA